MLPAGQTDCMLTKFSAFVIIELHTFKKDPLRIQWQGMLMLYEILFKKERFE